MSETPEIHVKQTLFRRHMPDYRYLKPSSQGMPRLRMKDMNPEFFFERPAPKKHKSVGMGRVCIDYSRGPRGGAKYPG